MKNISIVATINTEDLDEQYYSGEIRIDSNGGNETITVRMRVKENQPYLTVSPTVIDLGDIKSGEIIEKELTIKNEGDGILEGEIETTKSWIEVSEREFRLSKGKILKVKCKFNPLILDIGKYKEKIILTSNIGNYEITVLINRLPFSPKLMISTDNIDFGDVEIGSMSNSSINIWNDGEEPLKIEIISSLNWLILSQDKFILYKSQNVTLFLSINVEATVKEGIYEDSIDILSNGGNKKLRVKVNFTEQKIIIDLQIGNKFARVNDILYELDAPPIIRNGRTLVPVRFIAEAFGAKVDFIPHPTNEVQVRYKDKFIHLWINSIKAKIEYPPESGISSKVVTLETPPIIINGRTLVPLRFIGEEFGAKVAWNPEDQSIKIILRLKREN
ncbi:MAG TPA: copper amine oxidase N-terminal domain-containing protein [Caldisericia bacterium]|nr:copper amine oxidase N-terminal domain-containing protein [Caldisericia bacterium]